MKILVIEDNDFIQEQLCILFESRSHEVKCASEGAEGLEIIKDFDPEVILCDLMMPGMSGFEFIESYRQDPLGTRPVIAMTAIIGARGVSEESLLEQGFTQVVSKPFDFNTFIIDVESYQEAV